MKGWRTGTLTLVGAVTLVASVANATVMLKRMATDQVTREAARIVHGTVAAVRSARDGGGLPSTWVTIDVGQTLKGAHRSQVTFKQFGAAEPLADGTVTRIAALPRFAVGDEVVLFLRGESSRGFVSPVGLGQGIYRVDRKTAPRPLVRSEQLGGGTQDLGAFLAGIARLVAPSH